MGDNRSTTRSGSRGRRGLGAALALAILGGAMAGLIPASAAQAAAPGVTTLGSIVHVRGSDVWLMSPDRSVERMVTRDGSTPTADLTGSTGYGFPSQSDDGNVIVAIRKQQRTVTPGFDGYIWVMDRQGQLKHKFPAPKGFFASGCTNGVYPYGATDIAVSPDGTKVAFVTFTILNSGCLNSENHTQMWMADIDGTDMVEITRPMWNGLSDLEGPSWLTNTRLLMGARTSDINMHYVDLPGTVATAWDDTGREPDLKGGKLATHFPSNSFYDYRLWLYTSNGPGTPTQFRCSYRATAGDFDATIYGQNWSPDAAALTWEERDEDGVNEDLEGIYVVPVGDLATGCPDFSTRQLLVPGGYHPDWGPAAVGVAPPTLAINDVSVTEGNSSTKVATFTVTRSGATTAASSVSAATINGSAIAPDDYVTLTPTTVQFPAGDTTPKTVSVTVNGDTTVEPDETFSVKLTAPSGATISDDTGVGTITNDDVPPPTLAINDVAVTEGNSGTKVATFTITRSGSTTAPSSVMAATIDGTATASSDYLGLPATQVNFPAGDTTPKSVSVTVNGDTAVEPNEAFSVKLTSPTGATISDDTGVGTITNDDVPPAQTFTYTVGSTVSNGVPAAGAGNIESPGSIDTYTFTATAGQKVFVDYLSASTCGINWRLIGPADAAVFSSRGICGDPGQFTLAAAGTYTLTVDTPTGSATVGTYSFRITDVPPAQTFTYTVGITVSNGVPAAGAGNIESPGSVDTYTFTATAGQKVFVDYLSASTCGLNWRLIGPANATVFASRAICSDPGQLTLAAAGTYTLTVDTPTGSATVGTYSFRITDVPGAQTFPYTVGNTVSNGVPAAGAGNIESPGSVDTYTFTATAGQKVFVDYLTGTCGLNWRLIGPANATVFASRAICSDPGQLTLAAAGTYTLTVDTPTGSATVGTYSFRITDVPPAQTFPYTVGSTVSNGVPAVGAGNIESPGSVDTYTFTATAGQKVFVDHLTGTCGLNWRLIGPANATVFASRAICSDPGQLTLAAAGTYTLTVDTAATSAATGTYSFRITDVPAPQTFDYTVGTNVTNGVPVLRAELNAHRSAGLTGDGSATLDGQEGVLVRTAHHAVLQP
ncbi:MAG: Calx-beta domain-containing protein [Acidimicrobiales bacterium]